MGLYWKYYSDKVAGFLLFLIWLGLVYMAAKRDLQAFSRGGPLGVFYFFEALVWTLLAAIVGMRLFLAKLATRIVDQIFGGRAMLRKPPLALSPYHAALVAGRGAEVEPELLALQEQHPEHAELAELLLELYRKSPEQALAALERHFSVRRAADPRELRLVMHYADLQRQRQHPEAALPLLKRELHSAIYNSTEKQALQQRLEALAGRGDHV